MSHFVLVTLHLFAAIMFVGTVFFEVLILEGIRKPVGRERMRAVDRIVIDDGQTNRKAIVSCDAENRLRDRSRRALKAIPIRNSKYLNNRIEQDHRRIKRWVGPMFGFRSFASASATLAVLRWST